MSIQNSWFGRETPTESEQSEQHSFFQRILRKEKSSHTPVQRIEHVIYQTTQLPEKPKKIFNMKEYQKSCILSEQRSK